MALFIRFTDTSLEDLERGTSINDSDLKISEISKKEASKMFDCDESMIDSNNGYWIQVLNGLCGYMLYSDNIEDAIDEAIEIKDEKQFSFVGKCVIFEGIYSNNSKYVSDGDCFIPSKIIYEF